MKSNNLTISIPTPKCKMNCAYCISKMTGPANYNEELFLANMSKVMKLAEHANVNSVLVTAKGEPLDNWEMAKNMAIRFEDYPLEIQSNGKRFLADKNRDEVLMYYDVIALSFDSMEDLDKFKKEELHGYDNTFRLTLIVSDNIPVNFDEIVRKVKELGFDQLSLRNPTIPERVYDSKEAWKTTEWIENNTTRNIYDQLINYFSAYRKEDNDVAKVRELGFGAIIYDINGLAFTYFDYCVQDTNGGDDIRSLIYLEDGHMYTSWTYKSSKIF